LGVSRKVAFSMLTSMSKDMGVSPENAWRFLNGQPQLDESDKRSEFTRRWGASIKAQVNPNGPDPHAIDAAAHKDTLGGFPCNDQKVADKVAKLADIGSMKDKDVVSLITSANPRELAEIEKALAANGQDLTQILQAK